MHLLITLILSLLLSTTIGAESTKPQTRRMSVLENQDVKIWKTIIYPKSAQRLKMHRHNANRVVVALDSGTLKITNNYGKVHYLKLKKNQAYYLSKDIPGETHTDENMSPSPIKVIVIELRPS